MENFKSPVPVEWCARRVLTTAQLADCYKCTPRNISDNFNRAKKYFEEGVHYFKLEGEALRAFRDYSEKIGLVLSTNTPMLYLWMYQGCVRHCKMINTSEAWEVFDALEKFYFGQVKNVPVPAAKPAPNPARRAGQLKPARVYLLGMGKNRVKVGFSNNVITRTSKIERDVKTKSTQIYFTPLMSREDARLVEWAFKKIYSSQCIGGEFFSVDFAEACAAMDTFVTTVKS